MQELRKKLMEVMTMNNYTNLTADNTYSREFWNAMRGNKGAEVKLDAGRDNSTGTYSLPDVAQAEFTKELERQSIFRSLATVIKAYRGEYRILAKDSDDIAAWIPEGGEIPVFEGIGDFTQHEVGSHKLADIVRLDSDFVCDASFNFEDYLVSRLARNFGFAEEDAFVNGTGVNMPTGILDAAAGAKTGVTTAAITADDIITLFFSVDREYRKNAVWMMNDRTALHLRTLKDSTGNYLWRSTDDTILSHKVAISNYMPNPDSSKSPVIFGDMSYYWIIERKPLTLRPLVEKYAIYNQISYLSFEFLDAKLIRREAVKALTLTVGGK
jgi:HK97 family phage major capsid protein